ncbi:MAG TPA: adenylyl-sulfate kinase [Candidatus Acidoferrales bacterium]|nr:adenylyl-sulfate kinase [Candidatus Acidoferrales bacterium]
MNPGEGTKELLRFLTCGSVDDGKSTIIGRLLFESNGVYEDQLQSVRKASVQRGANIDLSLITDGLKAEREQAITIDVAYRYFSTPRREFIIADCPGHEEYTRNMVTGASTADLAVLLVDARKGILEQTRRHSYIVWLLGIRRMVVAINKMDLVGYSQETFVRIRRDFEETVSFMPDGGVEFIPVSAFVGDNVVQRSSNMAWYTGASLLEFLESVPVEDCRNLSDLRFPIQMVIRPDQDFRGYAGQINSGVMRTGQQILALPSGRRTRIARITLYDRVLQEAFAPQSVVVTLEDDIDLGRGDMLVDPRCVPLSSRQLHAELIWLSSRSLRVNVPYLLKHCSQILCGSVTRIVHRLNAHDLQNTAADNLGLNEIGSVEIQTHKPMFFDPYLHNRSMGSFVMIDPMTNETVSAGMALQSDFHHDTRVPLSVLKVCREGVVVWFTGLSGSGKTTICKFVATELQARGVRVETLDGDAVRTHLCSDLGFEKKDRDENVRRLGFVAELLASHGVLVLVSAISPYRAARDEVRQRIPDFLEVFVDAPLSVCEKRDPKGLYRKARAKEISKFTGLDDPYEPPLSPEVHCSTDQESIKASSDKVVAAILEALGLAPHQMESTIGFSTSVDG